MNIKMNHYLNLMSYIGQQWMKEHQSLMVTEESVAERSLVQTKIQ